MAGFLPRLLALTIDWLLGYAIAGFFVPFDDPTFGFVVLLVWYVLTTIPVALFGRTAGMVVLGVWVGVVGGGSVVGVPRAALRTLLIALVIPPLLRDEDGRGWHDRLTRTVVLRARG